jgi:hypothetical protein
MNGNGDYDDDDDGDDDDLMMAQLRARMEAMVTEGTTTTTTTSAANGDDHEDPLRFAAMEMDPGEPDNNNDDEQAMDALIAAEVAQAEAAAQAEATMSLANTSVPRADAAATGADTTTTLFDPSQQLRRPWDNVVAAGPPAEHPPPFDRPHYSRGRRVTVVAYIPATEGHEQLHNCLMRDFEREGSVASPGSSSSGHASNGSCHRPPQQQLLAYYPIPHKRPIETIMGHVEICAVLERDVPCQDDTSRKSDDDDDDHLHSDGDDDEEEETDEEEGVGGRGAGGGGFGCLGSSTKRKSGRRKQKQVDDSDDDDDDEDDCIVFRLTNRYVAVKVNYWTRIVQMRDRHAEDPMKVR